MLEHKNRRSSIKQPNKIRDIAKIIGRLDKGAKKTSTNEHASEKALKIMESIYFNLNNNDAE